LPALGVAQARKQDACATGGKPMILNPNCSELVTHLGVTEKDGVISALKILNGIEGYGVAWRVGDFAIPMLEEDIEEILIWPQGEDLETLRKWGIRLQIDLNRLIELWAARLAESPETQCEVANDIKEQMRERDNGVRAFELIENCPEKPGKRAGLGVYIRWRCYEGCDKPGLNICLTQHCMTSEFPIFHRIRRIFNSDYEAHDGGKVVDYERWLAEVTD